LSKRDERDVADALLAKAIGDEALATVEAVRGWAAFLYAIIVGVIVRFSLVASWIERE